MSRLASRTLMVLWCLLAIASALHAQPQYTLTDLGAFQPTAISGPWVVGQENGVPTRLNLDTGRKEVLADGGLGGSGVNDVNATGWAIGTTRINVGGTIYRAATVWRPDGSFTRLPGPLPHSGQSINDAITMAGSSASCPDGARAMRWWPDGREECLSASPPAFPNGGPSIQGHAVDDDHGVWLADIRVSGSRVARWATDGTSALVPTQPRFSEGLVIQDVNADGVVVGRDAYYLYAWRGTLAAGLVVLPPPPGLIGCGANGINAASTVVGWCTTPGIELVTAVLWTANDEVIDLNTRVESPVTLTHAEGINDDGQIIGRMDYTRGFLLTPIPARVAECGGNVPCQCGDTVMADYTFTHNLACTLHGFEAALLIGHGVTVNGAGFGLLGTGDGIGILFDEVQGSQVSGLHVTNFATGVRLRAAASGNVYRDAWVWNHAQQGIHLEQSAHRNWIWGVYSLLNGASGMRLEDVSENILAYNMAWSNPISLHMVRADQNTVWFNGWYGDRGHAVVLDESHGNSFYRNDVVCSGGGAVILHQSFDNTAQENTVRCPVLRSE